MLFAFINWDGSDGCLLREELRSAHSKYLRAASERMAFAGPLFADDGKTIIGSLLVLDFSTRQEADTWMREEPYVKAGLYSSMSIHLFSNRWPQKAGFVDD